MLRQHWFHVVNREPGGGGLQLVVYIVDVLHAFSFKPIAESGCSLLGVNRDAFFPGGASAEDTVELYAGFAGQFERLAELSVAHTGREIDKRLGRNIGGGVEQVNR